ncbi:MAG TPA: hypothetical protein VND65_16355 [Candidatus Binatia bacterium]|nr:hypothetical protein [Candidatus Binatia bacterium]
MNRILVGFILTTAILVIGLQAQAGPAPIGTVSVSKNQWSCPTTPPDDYPAGMTCQHAIVYCPNGPNGIAVQPLGVTFGYMTPPSPLGTIVFLSGEGGTTPNGGTPPFPAGTYSFTQYAEDYYNDGYQVILTAWDSAWEDVTNGGSGKKSVGYAACRPATFLNWVYGYFYVPIQSAYQPAGMCAQTASAGAGAGVVWWYCLHG